MLGSVRGRGLSTWTTALPLSKVAPPEAAQPPAQMEPEVCANGGALEDTDGAVLRPCARLKTAAQSGKEFQKGHWKAPDEHKGYYYN